MSSLLLNVITNKNFVNLESCIAEIPDPRVNGRVTYPLRTIIVIALCATIGGANDFTAIERFGWDHCDWLHASRDGSPADPRSAGVAPGSLHPAR